MTGAVRWGGNHMVASRSREPSPASPDPYESQRARDRERRRVASRPEVSAARPPRLNLDGLAIGAPLTAALIGVLLTEGEGALGNVAAGAPGGGGARAGDGEAGAAWHQELAAARLDPAAQAALAGRLAASTSGEIFDPVAASQGAAPAAMIPSTPGGTLMPPAATPATSNGSTWLRPA
jgi:hypothetical protein